MNKLHLITVIRRYSPQVNHGLRAPSIEVEDTLRGLGGRA